MDQFFLRREPFGGVLYHVGAGRLRFLSRPGFEICLGISRGWSDAEIEADIGTRFEVDDPELVRADIADLRDVLRRPERWTKKFTVAAGAAAAVIPTLSAPLELHWEITGKCNLRCRHCYNNSAAASPQPSLRQICSVVDELNDAKIKLRGIIVSGGEPLMHPQLRPILALLRPFAAELVLATNGTLVTEANIGWASEQIDVVNLSVDCADADSFAAFRGQPDVLEKALRALRLFRRQGTPVIAQTTVSRYNIGRLEALGELLQSEGATSWIVRMPLPMGRAQAHQHDFLGWSDAAAREDEFQAIRDRFAARFETLHIGNRFMWSYREPFVAEPEKSGLVSCAAGTMLATLRADGTMTPCAIFGDTVQAEAHSAPVWNGHFLSEWRNADCFTRMRRLDVAAISPCNSCSAMPDRCDAGCRALAFHTFGSVDDPDPGCLYVRTRRMAAPALSP